MDRSTFFEQILDLLEGGQRTSDASYYTSGQAQEGEYANVISTAFRRTEPGSPEREEFVRLLDEVGFWTDTDNRQYWIDLPSDAVDDIKSLEAAAEKRMPSIGGGVVGDAGDLRLQGDDVIAPGGAGTGLLQGGTVHRVSNPGGQADYFVAAYEYPPGSGHSFYYRFDTIEQLESVIGPGMGGGSYPIGPMIQERDLATWTDGGSSSDVIAVDGTFGAYIQDKISKATLAAGGLDPTKHSAIVNDPEMQLILAKAAEDSTMTDEQILAMMRDTGVYKDVLYPGIENFYAGYDDPEAQYNLYKNNVIPALKRMGIAADSDGTYNSNIRTLLDSGVSDVAITTFAPIYNKAATNQAYAGELSRWTERFTGQSVSDFGSWFDVLAGTAPEDVLEIAEVAGLSWVADQQGFEISDTQLEMLGQELDLQEGEGRQLFSNTSRQLLALGASGLRRGGLDADMILRAEAGIGGDVEAIKLKARKLAIEEGLVDDPSARLFTDYNREGAPVKLGLGSNVAEGA